MREIAILNQKGGVGKTTTVVNTGAALAAAGLRVVVVDLDPQAHLTIHLGLEPDTIKSGSYRVLTQSEEFQEAIVLVRPNLWLLPANINLVGAESELVSVVGRETILREAIRKMEGDFDYLIIDCPPSLGLLTLNALAAVGEILIPLQPHFLALQGFGKLLQTVDLVNKRINPDLKVKGILLCMFESRASLPKEVKADIEQFLDHARGTDCAWAEAQILPVCIRRNIKLAEAPSYGRTIFEYEQNCHGAEDYRKVAEFIHGQSQLPLQDAQVATDESLGQPADEARSIAYADVKDTQSNSAAMPPPQDIQPPADEGPAPSLGDVSSRADADTQGELPQSTPALKPPDMRPVTDQRVGRPSVEIDSIPGADSREPQSQSTQIPAAESEKTQDFS
ncbi:MAG: ParA family protein [Planctomycetota bacterium]|jgi:chromosome partitioning protein